MRKVLVVVDMQNDFISMALGTKEAISILPRVREKIAHFDGEVIFTRDTHSEDYLTTREGKLLPVPHCIKGTRGWEIEDSLKAYCGEVIFDKPTFGSTLLSAYLVKENAKTPIDSVTLVGLCTDICVVSNALIIKATFPDADVKVDSRCCAGVTPESHEAALRTMQMCQIEII